MPGIENRMVDSDTDSDTDSDFPQSTRLSYNWTGAGIVEVGEHGNTVTHLDWHRPISMAA